MLPKHVLHVLLPDAPDAPPADEPALPPVPADSGGVLPVSVPAAEHATNEETAEPTRSRATAKEDARTRRG